MNQCAWNDIVISVYKSRVNSVSGQSSSIAPYFVAFVTEFSISCYILIAFLSVVYLNRVSDIRFFPSSQFISEC